MPFVLNQIQSVLRWRGAMIKAARSDTFYRPHFFKQMLFGNSLFSLPFEKRTHCGGSVVGHSWRQVIVIPSLFFLSRIKL
jgi:hypothetical protein